jgi:hypothetical protein
MTSEKLSLVSLEVENMLRLKAVKLMLDPKGALVIEGKNEQGKSSVLKSLEMLLSGGKETPDEPIHGDATKGHIIATFGDIVVKKVFRKGKRPALTITTKEGARMQAPQTMLDKLLSHVSLDPVKFMDMDDREKTRVLSDIMGFDSAEFDAEIERLYNLRRDANREAKRLQAVAEATTFHEDAPDEEVSVSELMAELKKRQAQNAACAEHRQDRDATAIRLEEARNVVTRAHADVKEAVEALEVARRSLKDAETTVAQYESSVKEMTKLCVSDVPADEFEITEQIAAADETNAKVRANIEREKANQAVGVANDEAMKLHAQLEAAQASREKARLEARDRLPIPDLDITADAVLYKGKPLSQAGSSAELRVSVAVAMALNEDKRVKLLLIDDAEKLDSDNVKIVMEMAKEKGFQVLMARVGSGETASVMIEDGQIKS